MGSLPLTARAGCTNGFNETVVAQNQNPKSSEYSKVLFLFFPPLAASRLKTKAAGVAGTKYGTASY